MIPRKNHLFNYLQADFLVRALVRTIGLLLIAFGAVLWIAQRASVKAPPPPAPVAVAPAASPPTKHVRSHTQTSAAPVASPAPTPTPAPVKAAPLSTVKMIVSNPPTRHDFIVHIYDQDGWFDTGIPVTADLTIGIYVVSTAAGQTIPDTNWIRGLIGDKIIYPPKDLTVIGGAVSTWAPGSTPSNRVPDGSPEIPLPETAKTTLKLRIFPAGAAKDLQCRVKVFVYPADRAHPTAFTVAQQRELDELHKWELK
jgi:hypothetical protein